MPRSTAWLDGLRGICALGVVLHHCSLQWFSWHILEPWSPGQPFLKLPIIRLLISGTPHVYIFFVISGYGLSYRPLKLCRQGRFDEAASVISSSIFRRHARLFVPAAVITSFCAVMTQLNWYGKAEEMPGVALPAFEPPHLDGFWGQMKDFGWNELVFMDPIGRTIARGDPGKQVTQLHNPYDYALWTIPVEFHSSMVLLVVLMALSRVKSRARMVIVLVLAMLAEFIFIYWAVFLFLSGMLICDLRMEIEERSLRRPASKPGIESWSRVALGNMAGVVCFVLSLWALSTPHLAFGGREAPGFRILASMIPERFGDQMLMPFAAIGLVLTLDNNPSLQNLFTTSFAMYLGRISFTLSLIHGPLLNTLGHALARKSLAIVGGDTDERYLTAIALAAIFWWPFVISMSYFLHRFVDARVVRFTKWAYGKLLRADTRSIKEE
ncbi:O-acetyltransferase PaAT-1 [Diaporthe australafricana]|uniref:O-acetyltransferase PaAT-1 n=1 Tax=Diaporthe australafricana TaxID=127596 RepID=A0ABR3WLV9_9PEZI